MKTGFLIAILLTVILSGSTTRTLAASGDLDPTFGNGGIVTDYTSNVSVAKIVIQPDGKIVIVGTREITFPNQPAKKYLFIRRYTASGSLDTTYGTAGKQGAGYDAEVQADGKLVVIGWAPNSISSPCCGTVNTTSSIVWRFNADGTSDTTFGNSGAVVFNTIQRGNFHIEVYNGQAFVAYGAQFPLSPTVSYRFSRLSPLGVVDYSVTLPFIFNENEKAFSMKVNHVTGMIVAAGIKNNSQNAVLRAYGTNGSVAREFGSNGEAAISDCYVTAPEPMEFLPKDLVVQPDGKILVHRVQQGPLSPLGYSISRHLADGTSEQGFCTGGSLHPAIGNNLYLQADGRFFFYWGAFAVGYRFFPDGNPADAVYSFGPYATAIQPDQKFVTARSDEYITLERRLLD